MTQNPPQSQPLEKLPEADPEVLAVLGKGEPKARLRRRLTQIAIALAALGGLGFGGVRLWQKREADTKPILETMPVERRDIQVTVSATGTLEGLNTVEVGSEVSGKLTQVLVDFNDPVRAGQVLAVVDPEQSRAAVDEATAQVASADASIHEAKASLAEAQKKLARAREQRGAGLVSEQDFETTEATALRAEAALKSATASAILARATLKSAQSRLEKTTIISPIDGIVLSRLVEAGQTVAASMTTPVLFKLAQDLRKMSLSVSIDEADIGRVREGQEASFAVDTYPDRSFPSKVLSLRNEPVTVQNVVTYEAILAVDNGELLLRPGMTAAATLIIETRKSVLAVPNAALRFAPSEEVRKELRVPGVPKEPRKPTIAPKRAGNEVWLAEGGVPVMKSITIGASDGAFTEVIDGPIGEGAKVIVDVTEKKR